MGNRTATERPLRIQIWSYNYDPEPQGIAPLTRMLAVGLAGRGCEVLVVAAHPHYPEPKWGARLRPYRESRDGIPVLRLPLWIGRDSGLQRVRQELSFAAAQAAVSPLLPSADALIAVTPNFPALACAMAFSKVRRIPWIMWLQDIVTDGAASTGLLDQGSHVMKAAQRFERASYASASRVVVISEAFRSNLVAKGVPQDKIVRLFNPSSRQPETPNRIRARERPSILAMGNIGHSQGLDRVVEAFESSSGLEQIGARLVIAGHGVAADEVRDKIRSSRVEMPGVLYGDELEPVLRGASIGLVSQRADVAEFNLPSKLMNYMSYGLPVIASVRPESETARIVRESGAGWVADAANPGEFARTAHAVLSDEQALRDAGSAGFRFAQEQFHPGALAQHFEQLIRSVTGAVLPAFREEPATPQPEPIPAGVSATPDHAEGSGKWGRPPHGDRAPGPAPASADHTEGSGKWGRPMDGNGPPDEDRASDASSV
jgi:colanic acid biosynthesis glycosyl transferase WcaI